MREPEAIKKRENLYWVEMEDGHGAIAVINGVIIESSPSLKISLTGKKLTDILKMYRVKNIGEAQCQKNVSVIVEE